MEKANKRLEETENWGEIKEGDEENLSWQTEGMEIAPCEQRQKALCTFQPDSHGRSHQQQEERLESMKSSKSELGDNRTGWGQVNNQSQKEWKTVF